MRIMVKPLFTAIQCSPVLSVTTKYMDNSMLDLLCYTDEIHIVTASRGTFHL